MICPHCGKEHPGEAVFCPETGKSLSPKSVCPHCGQVHPPNAQFCPVTGKNLISTNELAIPTSRKRPGRVFTTLILLIITLSLMGGIAWMFLSQNTSSNIIPSFEKIISIVSSVTETTISATEVQNPEITITLTPGFTPTALPILTRTPQVQPTLTLSPLPTTDEPIGKIVYTCQIFKNNDRNLAT